MNSNNHFDMIDPSILKPGKLRDCAAGSIFVALRDDKNDDEKSFLIGTGYDDILAVAPRGGERPFQVMTLQQWPQRAGYAISDFAIEVDRSTAERRYKEEDCRVGELLVYPGGIAVVADDGHSKHIVDLRGQLQTGPGLMMIGFNRWELVLGSGAERQVLYHYTGRELLFGAFDPETDEEV